MKLLAELGFVFVIGLVLFELILWGLIAFYLEESDGI